MGRENYGRECQGREVGRLLPTCVGRIMSPYRGEDTRFPLGDNGRLHFQTVSTIKRL